MDNHLIKIYPGTLKTTMAFVCQFTDNVSGKQVSLIDNGRHGYVHTGELTSTMSVKTFIFDNKSPYEFTFDADKKSDQLTKNYYEFWMKDPRMRLVKPNQQINVNPDCLYIEDLTEAKRTKVVSIKDKRKALQKYETLSVRSIRNAAYYIGVPGADKMEEDDLYVNLIEPSTGIFVQPENLQRFLDFKEDDADTQLRINVRRAIEKKLVEKRNTTGRDTFYINNHPIGESEDAVIAYFDSNKEFYFQYIVERLGDEAEKEKKIDIDDPGKDYIESPDVIGLRATAKERYETLKGLGITGAKASSYHKFRGPDAAAKLTEAIKEADELIEKKQVVV